MCGIKAGQALKAPITCFHLCPDIVGPAFDRAPLFYREDQYSQAGSLVQVDPLSPL